MNRTKLVLGAALVAFFMTGCASNNKKHDQVQTDIQTLGSKVDQLASEVGSMRSDIQAAKEDSVRANHRLDNMSRNYKK